MDNKKNKLKMLFIDFEVFRYDWLCVIIEPESRKTFAIVNDAQQMKNYFYSHKDWIWVGFNIRQYDQFILKAILCDFNPAEVNDFIIVHDNKGYWYSDLFSQIRFPFYDVMSSIDRGLKFFEGSMGESIQESNVDFRMVRKLTQSEIDETIGYCTHDVEQTIKVFLARKKDFDASMGILKMFDLPLTDICKTKVQLAAKILDARAQKFNDEFDISFPDTMRIEKYIAVVDWYKDPANRDYDKSLDIMIAGVPHSFGWGGVHGAVEGYQKKGHFINMDVASLYPSLMIQYNLLSRACNPSRFKSIVDLRLKYKHEGNPLQQSLKVMINGTYGASKDRNNPLYDPRQANNVCVHGQLLLLDLIEHLEKMGAEIVQSNTDGVLVRMPDDYKGGIEQFYKDVDDVAYEWEQRTRLELEFDEYVEVFQGDVNNYLMVPEGPLYDEKGKPRWKVKGAYLKKQDKLDWDLHIVNKAIVDNMLFNTPVRKTIYECNNLKDFQLVKKIGAKYRTIRHGSKDLNEKCVRVFASKNYWDEGITKVKNDGSVAKMEGTPQRCRLVNGNINGEPVPEWLDRNWYCSLAESRLSKFKSNQTSLL